MKNCVYILFCKNKRYYVGSTVDLIIRLKKHIFGHVKATKYLRPITLCFHQSYSTLYEARQIEYWIKKQKSKKLIERIILEGKITKKFSSVG